MGTLRIDIEPSVLDWALRRTGLSDEKLRATFPKVNDWRAGGGASDAQPSQGTSEESANPIWAAPSTSAFRRRDRST